LRPARPTLAGRGFRAAGVVGPSVCSRGKRVSPGEGGTRGQTGVSPVMKKPRQAGAERPPREVSGATRGRGRLQTGGFFLVEDRTEEHHHPVSTRWRSEPSSASRSRSSGLGDQHAAFTLPLMVTAGRPVPVSPARSRPLRGLERAQRRGSSSAGQAIRVPARNAASASIEGARPPPDPLPSPTDNGQWGRQKRVRLLNSAGPTASVPSRSGLGQAPRLRVGRGPHLPARR